MRFQDLLLLYSLLIPSCSLIGCCDVFNGTKFFLGSMDTGSCWVDGLSQWGSSAGSCSSHSASGLRSSSPALAASTRLLGGGFKTTTRLLSALCGAQVMPARLPPPLPKSAVHPLTFPLLSLLQNKIHIFWKRFSETNLSEINRVLWEFLTLKCCHANPCP